MSIIMLDWRNRPSKKDIVHKIHTLLLDIDHLNKVTIELAETTRATAFKLEDYQGTRMWTRTKCSSSRNIANQEAHIAKFVAIGIEVSSISFRALHNCANLGRTLRTT